MFMKKFSVTTIHYETNTTATIEVFAKTLKRAKELACDNFQYRIVSIQQVDSYSWDKR